MRLALRLVWMLAVGLTLISIFFTWQQIRRDRRNMQQEVERRAGALTESLADSLEPAIAEKSKTQVQRVLKRFGKGRSSIGVVVYDNDGKVVAQTPELHGRFAAGPPPVLLRAMTADSNEGEFVRSDGASLHLYGVPLHQDKSIVGGLILVQETGNIDIRISRLWREAALRMLIQVLVIAGITVLIVRRSILHPLARTMQWIKAVRAGRASPMAAEPDDGIFSPFTEEVTTLARSFSDARASAELEARLRDTS